MKKTLPVLMFLLAISIIGKPQVIDSLSKGSPTPKLKVPKLFSTPEYPVKLNKTALWTTAVVEAGLYAGELAFLNTIWWKDRETVPFFFTNDNSGYLQIDKWGHTTTAYIESYLAYYAYRKTGLSKKTSLWIGGLTGFALQLPIEIWDGVVEGWGFSWGDISANTLGACVMAGQEYFFDDQIVKMKFSFSRSEDAKYAPEALGNSYFKSLSKDYNGHTYWLSGNLSKILPKSNLPPWLSVAVGYSANGMYGEYDNHYRPEIPNSDRTRQFLLSLDVNWDNIPTNSQFLKVLFKGLDIIKIPFPTLELNSKGQYQGYWLYF
jgi:hypothetical protein